MRTVGILHPGAMGAAMAGQIVTAGHSVLWVPDNRSQATADRARQAGLLSVSIGELVRRADVILSICPPAAAEEVARSAHGYDGLWVEANAIAPHRVTVIAGMLPHAATVDGAVIGSPPREGKATTLYLSGPGTPVDEVRELFAGTRVDVRVMGDAIGRASALKMAYSSYQKASRVLASVAYALAAEHGVDAELLEIAARRPGSYLAEVEYIPKTAARAWRWGPEMIEVAETLANAGLPDDMAHAAARVLSRWPQTSEDDSVEISDALALLTREPAGE
jgi:3-hydroxyisobutyrate dehydrogenase-like beta-hydroxyacid dehydrogenase